MCTFIFQLFLVFNNIIISNFIYLFNSINTHTLSLYNLSKIKVVRCLERDDFFPSEDI